MDAETQTYLEDAKGPTLGGFLSLRKRPGNIAYLLLACGQWFRLRIFTVYGFVNPRWRRLTLFKRGAGILSAVENCQAIVMPLDWYAGLPSLRLGQGAGGIAPREVVLPTSRQTYEDSLFSRAVEDPEDEMAMHRFSWLLKLLYANPTPETMACGQGAIQYWIDSFGARFQERADAYSTADRLVNWIFFLCHARAEIRLDPRDGEILGRSLAEQIFFLVHHLEYRGSFTNNHILADARALYIAGTLLRLSSIEKIAREILVKEAPILIKTGWVQEDSTHYQHLLAKWFLEMTWAARCGGNGLFAGWLQDQTEQILSACETLQSSVSAKEFPLFGDISPDLEPSWFIGGPFNNEPVRLSPWFGGSGLSRTLELSTEKCASGVASSSHRIWHKIEMGGTECWICGRARRIASHGHNDNGSFVLFYAGRPLIVDVGRQSYSNLSGPQDERSSGRHSTAQINGLGPDIEPFIRGAGLFMMHSIFKAEEHSSAGISFEVSYADRTSVLHRSLTCSSFGWNCRDQVSSRMKHNNYRLTLPFSGVLSSATKDVLKFCDGWHVKLFLPVGLRFTVDKNGSRSVSYGHTVPVTTVTIEGNVSPQDEVRVELEIDRAFAESYGS